MNIFFHNYDNGASNVINDEFFKSTEKPDWLNELENNKQRTKDLKKLGRYLTIVSNQTKDIVSSVVSLKDIKSLKGTDGLWQIRFNQYRVLFFFIGEPTTIIILKPFQKNQNDTPPEEIRKAHEIKSDYKTFFDKLK